MSATALRAWVGPAVAVAILAVLLARVGSDPALHGLRAADGPLLAVAVVLTAVATACCAWRWQVVGAGLGADIDFRAAYLSCFGAQFLNATLPAGVLGDVHRALEHGQRTTRTGPAARSVLWERTLGLAVQVTVTAGVVGIAGGPLAPAALAVGAVALGLAALAFSWRPIRTDLAAVIGSPRAAAAVVVASLGVATCHAAVLIAAMAATGLDLTMPRTVTLALAVLLGSTVPASIAGWGPREGVAAAAFAAVGLPAGDGLAVSVAYGVAALVATLPGAVALLLARLLLRRREARHVPS